MILFAATGLNNYAKCSRLYLQLISNLPVSYHWLYMFSEWVWFSRCPTGLSTDLMIEQTMMRTIKGKGGLTKGREMTGSVAAAWVSIFLQCANVHLTMSSLTGLHLTNQQHADVVVSWVLRDVMDMKKFAIKIVLPVSLLVALVTDSRWKLLQFRNIPPRKCGSPPLWIFDNCYLISWKWWMIGN